MQLKKAWLITDGKQGMKAQVEGVANALGLEYSHIIVSPKKPWKYFAPWGPVPPEHLPGGKQSPFQGAFPDLLVATGRHAVPYFLRMRKIMQKQQHLHVSVMLQNPKTGKNSADLIWVPEHDRLKGENIIHSVTSPHKYSLDYLKRHHSKAPPWIEELPHPRLAVILGGASRRFTFPEEDIERLLISLKHMIPHIGSILVTPSRRSGKSMLKKLEKATRHIPRYFWAGDGYNPYPDFLAQADMFLVTGDSVNMTGEPCATGKPVYVFMPSGKMGKMAMFHEAMRSAGATRPAPETEVKELKTWEYEPLDSSRLIAASILKIWHDKYANGQ